MSVVQFKKQNQEKDWDRFNRMNTENFWAVITPNGHWVDSAISYEVALSIVAEFEQAKLGKNLSTEESIKFFSSKSGKPYYGLNIIHSRMLRNLYENTNFLID